MVKIPCAFSGENWLFTLNRVLPSQARVRATDYVSGDLTVKIRDGLFVGGRVNGLGGRRHLPPFLPVSSQIKLNNLRAARHLQLFTRTEPAGQRARDGDGRFACGTRCWTRARTELSIRAVSPPERGVPRCAILVASA